MKKSNGFLVAGAERWFFIKAGLDRFWFCGSIFPVKIKFLKVCEAPQQHTRYCGDGCCSWPAWDRTWFNPDEEADPEEPGHKIDLSGLKFRVDYDIIEYP